MGGAINLSSDLPCKPCNRTLDKLANTQADHTAAPNKTQKTTHLQND